jgi:hypothetical protein
MFVLKSTENFAVKIYNLINLIKIQFHYDFGVKIKSAIIIANWRYWRWGTPQGIAHHRIHFQSSLVTMYNLNDTFNFEILVAIRANSKNFNSI